MASQVVGFHWVDDTGTFAHPNGDGTPINDAELQRILAEVNSVFLMADPTFGGRMHAEGFGAHSFAAAGSGSQAVLVRNTQAGSGNNAQLVAQADGAGIVAVQMASTTFTPSGGLLASGARILSTGAGGLSIFASHASGDVRIHARNSATPVVTLGATVVSTVPVRLEASVPQVIWRDTDGGTNQKAWFIGCNDNVWRIQTLADDEVATVVMVELERSGTTPVAMRVAGKMEVFDGNFSTSANAQLRVGFAAGSTAPAVLQCTEPGVSTAHVILGCNYYGSTGSASARINTSIGGSFIRLANTGVTTVCRVSAAGAVSTSWTMDASGHLLPGSAVQDIATDATPINHSYVNTVHAQRVTFRSSGTSYLAVDDAVPFQDIILQVNPNTTRVVFGGSGGGVSNAGMSITKWGFTVIEANRRTSDGVIISLLQDGTEEGSISVSGNTVSYNAFCGSHYTQLEDGQSVPLKGTLMVSTGSVIGVAGEEKFPSVEPSSSRGQKGVYGAWHAELTDDPTKHVWARQDRPVYLIAALGLWYLRVTDTGGDITNGDLLHASPLEGLAERQVEADGTTYIPQVLDSTAARARVGVTWSAVSPNARGVKEAYIPITYLT